MRCHAHALPVQGMSCHNMLCHTMSCHTMARNDMACMSWHAMAKTKAFRKWPMSSNCSQVRQQNATGQILYNTYIYIYPYVLVNTHTHIYTHTEPLTSMHSYIHSCMYTHFANICDLQQHKACGARIRSLLSFSCIILVIEVLCEHQMKL